MAHTKRLSYNYHDSGLLAVTLGPRHEVLLRIALDPVWNEGKTIECHFRAGDIKNWEEVEQYFRRLPFPKAPDAFSDTVVQLAWTGTGDIELELAHSGYVKLLRPKVMET